MAASIATMTLKPLNESELNFVNNQVNAAFLRKFGSSQGFGMFCNVAKQQGFKCAGGTQAKGSYATYLKNAKVGNTNLFAQMTAAYGALDGFTKAAMAKKITKGKALQAKTFNTGCFTKFTVSELKEIADVAGVSVSGNKADVCAQLTASGVDLDAFWAGGQNVTINPKAKQVGPAAWQAYARSTKKRGRVPRSYAQVEGYTSAAPDPNGLTAGEVAFWDKLNGAS